MQPEIDRSVIGKEFDRTDYTTVTDEQIVTYAEACGEPLPVPDGGPLQASPTFVVRLHGRNFMPPELIGGLGRGGFDAGKDIEFGMPVRSGDTLTSSSTVHDIYEKTGRSGTMVFIVLRTVVNNQRGERVAAIDQKMMFK